MKGGDRKMEIFYNFQTKQWECNEREMYWGQKKPLIYSESNLPTPLQFSLNQLHNRLGPLIGILTGRNSNNELTGSGPLFRHLQENIIKHQGLTVVFTMDDLIGERITGYMYQPRENKWYEVMTPLPEFIFNRLPYELNDSESFKEFSLFCRRRKIPILHPFFLNTQEVEKIFLSSAIIKEHIPKIKFIQSKLDFIKNMYLFKEAYLIPRNNYQKKEWILIQLTTSSHITVTRFNKQRSFTSFDTFFYEYDYLFYQYPVHLRQYIPATEQFTILIHPQQKKKVIAIQYNEYTKPSMRNEQFIHQISPVIFQLLDKISTQWIELAVEITIFKNNYYITDFQFKPFYTEPFEVEEKRMESLIETFFHLTNYELL